MRQPETDLFGEVIPVRAPDARRKISYAARPGTGPKGQRCNTCVHGQRVLSRGVRSWKCELRAAVWDQFGSDIKPGAPACREWQRKPFRAESLSR